MLVGLRYRQLRTRYFHECEYIIRIEMKEAGKTVTR